MASIFPPIIDINWFSLAFLSMRRFLSQIFTNNILIIHLKCFPLEFKFVVEFFYKLKKLRIHLILLWVKISKQGKE